MSSDDTAVIIVMDLQDSLDLLGVELGSSSGTGVTSGEGNEMIGVAAETVSYVSEVADEEPTTIPEIQTEINVSCVFVLSVTYVPYGVYPELPSGM
jgi:hypothetical protein